MSLSSSGLGRHYGGLKLEIRKQWRVVKKEEVEGCLYTKELKPM